MFGLLGAGLLVLAGCSDATTEGAAADSTTSTLVATTIVTTTTAPTTTEVPEPDEPECLVTVAAGDSLGRIAANVDGVELTQLQDENRLDSDTVIHPGDQLDICVGNDFDDVLGVSRLGPEPAAAIRQQEELNDLFSQYRMIPLVVDGDSGQLTRQMVCTARLGLGMTPSVAHLAPGSDEEAEIFAAERLGVPAGAATWASKWILIDKTCQVMFIGEGEELVNIYPTSTGEPGYETHVGQSFTAFRYDPAVETDGWHDSSNFPVDVDNPLNGNMYKPLYFNEGQAIHGANYVPPNPQSKGCARTFPLHQDELLRWIGLDDLTEPTWRTSDIGVTVTVQGDYRPID